MSLKNFKSIEKRLHYEHNRAIYLSIHECYVNLIKSGKKQYEYRTVEIRKHIDVGFVHIVKAKRNEVVFMFEVLDVICDTRDKLWKKTGRYSGMYKECFDTYFKDPARPCYAIKIGKLYRCKPFDSQEVFGMVQPQRPAYIEELRSYLPSIKKRKYKHRK